jgi:hypothetical protein
MAARDIARASNIPFILAAAYFIAVALLKEGSGYVVIGAALCLIAFGLGSRKEISVSSPWRMATSAFCIILFATQTVADSFVLTLSNYYVIASLLINGAFLIVFIGVLLYCGNELLKSRKEERLAEPEEEAEQEDERRESRKAAYLSEKA